MSEYFAEFERALEAQQQKNLEAQDAYDDSLSVNESPIHEQDSVSLGRSDNFRYDPGLSGGDQVGVRIGPPEAIPEPDGYASASDGSTDVMGAGTAMDPSIPSDTGDGSPSIWDRLMFAKEKLDADIEEEKKRRIAAQMDWALKEKRGPLANMYRRDQERRVSPEYKKTAEERGRTENPEATMLPAERQRRLNTAIPDVPAGATAGATSVSGEPSPQTGDDGILTMGGFSGIRKESPVPGPVAGPAQAIRQAASQPPAQSIKEYIKMMREQGKTPSFTNIAGSPGQPQVPGQAPGQDQYYMPEKGRVITSGPTGYNERGTMDARKPLGDVPEFKHGGDPFDNAKALVMKDLPQIWNRITGGGVPMDQATPDQVKQVQDIASKLGNEYLKITTASRAEMAKLVGDGYLPIDIEYYQKTGDITNLRKVHDPKDYLSAEGIEKIQARNETLITKKYTDALGNLKVEPAQIIKEATDLTRQCIALNNIGARNMRGQPGAPGPGVPAGSEEPQGNPKESAVRKQLTEEENKQFSAMLSRNASLRDQGMGNAERNKKIKEEFPGLSLKISKLSV